MWIYTRPEVVGTRTQMTGEQDILLPNGKNTISVPDYEDVDISVIAAYHLRWSKGRLVEWERLEAS